MIFSACQGHVNHPLGTPRNKGDNKTLFHEDVGKRIRILWGIQKKIVDLVLFLEKGTRDQHTRII